MSRKGNSRHYEDIYVKHECQSCKRCFIVGEKLSEDMLLLCPYCQSPNIEVVAASTQESLENMDMGCLGLYYSLYDDGSLMLYTEHEFAATLKERRDASTDSIAIDCISKYCDKRDSRS